jgi:hypothetical protein
MATTTTAAKKRSTTRKAATKTTARKTRVKRVAPPITEEVRKAGAAALARFEEVLLDEEGIGFEGAATRELKGTRSGFMKTVRMEDEAGKRTQAVITVVFKERAARKPRVAKKKTVNKKAVQADES